MTTIVDATAVGPDERAFRAHVASAAFQAGVDRGHWRVVSINWPQALMAVTAAARPGSPDEFFLRLDLSGYPQQAPTATPWNPVADDVLPAGRRPRGEIVGLVFRSDWKEGRALYAPYDRVALQAHRNWLARYPGDAWTAGRDITFFLKQVHRLLNCDDYLGAAL